jgi:hypothetical protein
MSVIEFVELTGVFSAPKISLIAMASYISPKGVEVA